LLKLGRNPHLVRYHGLYTDPADGLCVLVTEFARLGSLDKHLEQPTRTYQCSSFTHPNIPRKMQLHAVNAS